MRKQTVGEITLALLITGCTGSVDGLLEQDQSPPVTVEVAGTVVTRATTTTAPSTTSTAPPTTTTPERTLPGNGVELASEPTPVGHWSYHPAVRWADPETIESGGQTWSTPDGRVTVREGAPPSGGTNDETTLALERAIHEDFAGVKVYASDYYYHEGGFLVYWVRFDSVDTEAWVPVQRYWVVDETSSLELTLVGTGSETFDSDLVLVQGVVNGVTVAR